VNVLMVVAHPRQTSLTHAAARAYGAVLEARGHRLDWADLAAEGFDPAMHPEDEPDWNDDAKVYSPQVQAEMARIERNAATVLVFPVWWWAMPALMKGWIDRVWNNGWAYGARHYPHERVAMLGIAGTTRPTYVRKGYDVAMRTQLLVGVLQYCGVARPSLDVLYGAIEGEGQVAALLEEAKRLAEAF